MRDSGVEEDGGVNRTVDSRVEGRVKSLEELLVRGDWPALVDNSRSGGERPRTRPGHEVPDALLCVRYVSNAVIKKGTLSVLDGRAESCTGGVKFARCGGSAGAEGDSVHVQDSDLNVGVLDGCVAIWVGGKGICHDAAGEGGDGEPVRFSKEERGDSVVWASIVPDDMAERGARDVKLALARPYVELAPGPHRIGAGGVPPAIGAVADVGDDRVPQPRPREGGHEAVDTAL